MNWKRYFQLGVVFYMLNPTLKPGEKEYLEALAKIAADPYFDAVEIAAISDSQVRNEVKELLTHAGLQIVYATQPGMLEERFNLAASEESDRIKAINLVKEAVEQAYEIDAKRVVIMDGYTSYPGDEEAPKALEFLQESLAEICSFVECQGSLELSIETFDRTVEKCCLLGPTKLAAQVINKLASEHCCLGLTLDSAHLALLGETWEEALAQGEGLIQQLHLGNCVKKEGHPLSGDVHPPLGYEQGEIGVLEIAEIFPKLMRSGLIRSHDPSPLLISLEVSGDIYGAELTLAHCKRIIDRAWNLSV